MKRIFTSHDSAEVGFLKSLLEEAGIECFIRNETQAYITAAFPELWIAKDEDLPVADEICRQWRQSGADQSRWKCNTCGEELEAQFAACWNCGTLRQASDVPRATVGRESLPDGSASETAPASTSVRKPFPDFVVILLALAAFVLDLYFRGGYLANPIAALRYPVYTALWYTGQQMSLAQGWKDTSGFLKWVRDWGELRTDHDTTDFCEDVLRDTLALPQRSRQPSTNTLRLRANLVVLLAESGRWSHCTNDLSILSTDPRAADFVLAAKVLYGTNKDISITEINDPAAVLGDTWFQTKFDSRWSRLRGHEAESARLTKWLANDAAEMQRKHLVVLGVAGIGQVLGLFGLGWLFLMRGQLATFKGSLVVPWVGWEGLGITFAAWALGIFLNLLLYIFGLGLISQFGYYLIFWMPLVWLLWRRHARHDSRPLKALFSIHPWAPRGSMLIMAGLATFMLDRFALVGINGGAHALGMKSNWAETIYEPELFEPWNLRWMILTSVVLFGPIGEEILHRGVLFPALRKWFSVPAAALLSATVFALPHYYSWPGFLALVGFGTISALSVHLTGSLIPAIIGHVLTNLVWAAGFSWLFGN